MADERSTNPASGSEALEQMMANFSNVSGDKSETSESSGENYEDPEDTPEIKEAKRNTPPSEEYSFTERDVMLYNLGIGAKASELKWTYENADGFEVSDCGSCVVSEADE
jgi:multifunctional beta-oxidation protein